VIINSGKYAHDFLSDVMEWAFDNLDKTQGYRVGYDLNDQIIFETGGDVYLRDLAPTLQCGFNPCPLN